MKELLYQLSYIAIVCDAAARGCSRELAEAERFELSRRVLAACWVSKPEPSTTRPRFHDCRRRRAPGYVESKLADKRDSVIGQSFLSTTCYQAALATTRALGEHRHHALFVLHRAEIARFTWT
jgi:hypothetical protein